MRKDNHHSSRQEGGSVKPEKQGRREEGASWATTPEARAQEGVFASHQETQQAMREQEAASNMIEAAPSSSHDDSSSIGHQATDSHVPNADLSTSNEPANPPASFESSCSSDALTTTPSSAPLAYGVSSEAVDSSTQPASHVSAPVLINQSASNAQPYDYYSGDRYDIYGHHQYDDYYLWDDYFLWDDYYGHDDYNPHLYYDIGTYPDAQPSHLSAYDYADQSHSYDSTASRYHEIRWPDESRATEPFESSAAAAAGIILAGERIEEASAAPYEPASQAFEGFTQTSYAQNDILEGQSTPYLQSETSPLLDFAGSYQVAQIDQAAPSSYVDNRQAEAFFSPDAYGTPALNGTVLSPEHPSIATPTPVTPQAHIPVQTYPASSQAADILSSAETATVQHALNQDVALDTTYQLSAFGQPSPVAQSQEASVPNLIDDRQATNLLQDATSQTVAQTTDSSQEVLASYALLGDSQPSLTPVLDANASETPLCQTASATPVAAASLLHSESSVSQPLASESSSSFQTHAVSEPHAPYLHASEAGNLLDDGVLHQLQNQPFAAEALGHMPMQEASVTNLLDERQAANLIQDASTQAVYLSTDSMQATASPYTPLEDTGSSLHDIANADDSRACLIQATHPTMSETSSLLHSEAPLSQSLVSESGPSFQVQGTSGQHASVLQAPDAGNLLDDSVLHQLQNQLLTTSSLSNATPQTGTIALGGSSSSPLQSGESAASRLTVNRLDDIRDDLQFINSRNIDIQPEGISVALTGSVAYSALHTNESQPQESFSFNASDLLALQNHANEARGVGKNDLGGLLIDSDARLNQSKEFLVTPNDDAKLTDTLDSLIHESSAVALVSNHSEAKEPHSERFETQGSEFKGSESKARQPKDAEASDTVPDVIVSPVSKDALVASDRKSAASALGNMAGAAALGTLKFTGRAAKAGTKKTIGALDYAANVLMREDEDLAHVADLDDVVHDGIDFMHRHAPSSHKESMIDRLISSERSVNDAIVGRHGKRVEKGIVEAGFTEGSLAAEVGFGKSDRGPKTQKASDSVLKVKKSYVREKPEPVNAGALFAATKESGTFSSKADLLEKGPTGLKAVAAKDSDQQGAEKHLLEKGEKKDSPGKQKPATERERALEKKKADKKAARKEKNDSKAMSVVKSGGNAGMKGALLVGGMAASSTKKALASRNEEIAVALSTVDKTKKTVKGVKTLVKLPFTIYHRVKQAVIAVINTVKHLFNFAATLTSLGPVGAVIALALFFLIIVVIVVLFATASIINDEQEVSEVSALVAELDSDLTDEIHEMGNQPILYLDASNTYNQKGNKNQSLTKDADLADDEADYQEVIASSVTVQTDPSAIAAYIDAKYTGNWQVGAASWKYTIDAFGETWNIIEWDDMPEWAWKGLNKINRVDFKITLRNELTDILMEDFDVEEFLARDIGSDTAEEFATVIYDNQVQGVNEEVLTQIIKDSVAAYESDLELSDDDYQKLYYQMQQVIADLIGEEDPYAFVYDEIVVLHAQMNWWSDRYDIFTDIANILDGPNIPVGYGSGTDNKYGYPNSNGYDEEELANWDGFNEVSVYGISEAGTGSVTADGTHITNTWDDATMGIACEGLQNSIFAYWSSDYKAATGVSSGQPVKITLYNPITGKSVTAQVIDCGGWRGFNPNYAGMNADRQWDLLPAVWKALGGSESAGTMKVYWRVDPDAVVGEPALEKKSIEGYLWPEETDENNDVITITRPTLIVHDIQDALNNETLMELIIDRESFATDAEFEAIKSFVITKVKDVMKTLLTMENSEGETYVDYNYIRRNLGDPFGDDKNGDPREWVITHRFNPGYEDFDEEEAYVEIKPLDDVKTVKAILEGEVEEIDDGVVTIRSYIDTANSSEVVYSELTDIKVKEGDEIKEGQTIGKMSGDTLCVSYYEINDAALQRETKKDWAYDPGLYMMGFAGYEEPAEPEEYIGPTSDYSGCQTVVEFAHSRLGCPYVWGATGPNTFDCSGLTQWCYAQAGITIPRNSEAQHDAAAAAGNLVSLSKLQPGDILWRSGHVGIYIGDGKYIHAPHTGDVVKISGDIFSFQCGLRFS